jgi:hypothetical protein
MINNYCEPIVGNWYRNKEVTNEIFKVVAIDHDERLIEIQYFDGQIGEFDLGTWLESNIIEIAEPEDWSGAYELSKEDLSEYKSEVIKPETKDGPINILENGETNLEEDQ